MYEVVRELVGKEEIPPFYEIGYDLPFRKLEGIRERLGEEFLRTGATAQIRRGDNVAITAGSREITDITKILGFLWSL